MYILDKFRHGANAPGLSRYKNLSVDIQGTNRILRWYYRMFIGDIWYDSWLLHKACVISNLPFSNMDFDVGAMPWKERTVLFNRMAARESHTKKESSTAGIQ